MKIKAIALSLGITLFSGTASAIPMLDLVWSGTTGSGTPGGTVIEAAIGDILQVDVIVTIDGAGFTGAAWDLLGIGVTAISNTLIPGAGGPPECPSPPNLAPGVCFSTTFKTFAPLGVGVIDAGANTTGYDLAGVTPEFTPSTMTIGRGLFEVTAGSGEVSTGFTPGIQGVTDGGFVYYGPDDVQVSKVFFRVTNVVPEPTTLALLGIGLAGIGYSRKRKAA